KEEQLQKIKQNSINIIEKEVGEILHQSGKIKTLIFKDGSKEGFDAAYAAIPFEQHSDIPKSLGCEFTEMGHIKVDAFQKTTIPGVYACGDNSSMMRSVANAVANGNIVGA